MSDGRFKPNTKHPKWRSDKQVLDLLNKKNIGCLILTGRIELRARSRRFCETFCYKCKKTDWKLVDNILSGKITNCICQRAVKYHCPRDVAKKLGNRYDAIVQRCERNTHCSSKHYKGRGIKNNFKSRESFVKWALKTYPGTDFKNMDFDRTNNNGHYEPNNLQLVPRSVNARNKTR